MQVRIAIKEDEMEAYRQKDGTYMLVGRTYVFREKIKSLGGRWDGNHWFVSEGSLRELGCQKMVRVRVAAHCHEEEQEILVPEKDVERGVHRMGCGWCDRSYLSGDDVKILEVIAETP